MINVTNLNKRFDKIEVLKNVSFNMNKGDVISIIGPSGSGKSTLLRCLIGLENIDNGEIEVTGVSLTSKKSDVKTKIQTMKKMGMVFQSFNLFPHKTVLENMIEAPVFVSKVKKADAISLADELLAKVGLSDKRDSYPSQLSGGQKQRVAIARALAMKPEVLFFDEPTSALDPELVGEVLNVIKELSNEDMTMIIVTHEMTFAREVSDRILFMDQGQVLCDSSPEEIFTNPSHERVKSFIESLSYHA